MGLYKPAALSLAIALLLGGIMAVASWAPDPDERLPNEVHFPISCGEWSQRQFDRATTLFAMVCAFGEHLCGHSQA